LQFTIKPDIKIVPLVLHKVVIDGVVEFEDVKVEDFRSILNLKDVSFGSLESAFLSNKQHIVCLTFDDGYSSDWEIVFPILQEYSVTATFFIVTDWVGSDGYLTRSQIKKMSDAGMQIGSHTHTHPNLLTLDSSSVDDELRCSRLFLEDLLGKEVDTFSFPFGFESSNLIYKVFQEGYKYCCTSRHGIVTSPKNILPRNSINSTTSIDKISVIVNANYSTRMLWGIEDVSKLVLKKYFSSFYFKIRSSISNM
jgi:peptidoglycan/xylan/chitin deacetylase (PgdA/CDA1 family)